MTGIDSLISSSSVEPMRISRVNNIELKSGSYVLYWMKNSFRAEMNPALNLAIDIANALGLPVLVMVTPDSTLCDFNRQQYFFMVDGIKEVHDLLEKKSIRMIAGTEHAPDAVRCYVEECAVLISDCAYMRDEKLLEKEVAVNTDSPFISVESNVIIPLNSLPRKEEYSAATLRPKIMKLLPVYLNPMPDPIPEHSSLQIKIHGMESLPRHDLFGNRQNDYGFKPVPGIRAGTSAADKLLRDFISNKLHHYHEERNDPDRDVTSLLSPYLHFGQVAPVKVALAVIDNREGNEVSVTDFLDELIVRRELSFNFVNYNGNYDNINCLPAWARETLRVNSSVEREYIYSLSGFENCATHDSFWNASQNQLVTTGIIHNYMRMYWGKKIIEWTESPDIAYRYMVYLNNKYALDGNDPNSFAGIAWCFGKHDRPWANRPVFGKVRYMNAGGLKRKFRMTEYMNRYGIH